MKKLCSILLLLLFLSACGSPVRSERAILNEMITEFGSGKHDPAKTAQLLAELRQQNPDSGEKWQEIMDYWDYVNSMPITYDLLPEDLQTEGKLAIVVLGYQLEADGGMRPELVGRLETALGCAAQYPEAYLLCTGGGTASGNPGATEAGAMAAWLTEQGIAPERIILEDKSKTTAQNAQFSHAILSEQYPDVTELVIVTSDYHIPWGSVLFQTQSILLGETRPRVIAHAALHTQQTNTYLRTQAAHMRELAGL